MSFLFGDSSKFPLDFNFLSTLEKFMPCATKVVMLEAESEVGTSAAVAHGRERAEAVEAVQSLHDRVMRSLDGALADPGPGGTMSLAQTESHPAAIAYAKKVRELTAQLVDEQRESAKAANEAEALQGKNERERRANDVKKEIETFLKSAELEMLTARVSFSLVEGRNETNAVLRTQGGIVMGFSLACQKVAAWNAPRKVSDFATNVDLMVGVKKSFFKGVVTPEAMHLDDFIISRADLNAEVLLLSLRKKITDKDSCVFKVRRTERGLAGEFERPDEPNAKSIPSGLGPEDLDKLDKLWRAIRASFDELFPHKEAVTHLELDGRDVLKERLGLALINRFVATFAPLVNEIAMKSPNREELSLKIETADGRRQEIYLKKDSLTKNLEPLAAKDRNLFAPLGLESWVPSLTMRPPSVNSPS